eukprot:5316879-Prymnesium_polylepis.1
MQIELTHKRRPIGSHVVLSSAAAADDKRTAIHLAASEGNLEVVKFLVDEAGIDPSPEDRWGGTPLDDAKRQSHTAVMEYLKSKAGKAGKPAGSSMCIVL